MGNVNLTDKDLIRSYLSGDEKSFEILLNRNKDRVFGYIMSKVRNQSLANDIFQEVFIKVIRTFKNGSYNEEGKFLPWVSRIAHNLAIDHFRKAKRYPTIVMEDGSNVFNTLEFSEVSIESKKIQEDTHALLRDLIRELPDSQREVLMMRHYMQMSFQGIADATNVSINTALGRMRYALINLRKKMDKKNIAYDQNLYPR